MTPLAIVVAVVTLCVGLTSLAAIAVALGKVLQRLEEIARVVVKVEGWVEDLKKSAHDQRGAHQLTVVQVEALKADLGELGKKVSLVTDLAHEIVKDLAGVSKDVARHDAELSSLRSITPAHGLPAPRSPR